MFEKKYFSLKQEILSSEVIPKHLAIIMDGNGRWSKVNNLPRNFGHKKGAETAKSIVKSCLDFGIKYLTLYAFSSENWKRSDDEINALMTLFRYYLNSSEIREFHKLGIRLHVIGDVSKFDQDIQSKILEATEYTKDNDKLNLIIALNYGSREEIVFAVKNIAKEIIDNKYKIDDINYDIIKNNLYTANFPDPDLLIRTSGEKRISNFLLLQSSYTEFYFSDKLWPDFDEEELQKAIIDFSKRQRRFGG